MTELQRRQVEALLRELIPPRQSQPTFGFTQTQIHDLYDKLVRVGLMTGRQGLAEFRD